MLTSFDGALLSRGPSCSFDVFAGELVPDGEAYLLERRLRQVILESTSQCVEELVSGHLVRCLLLLVDAVLHGEGHCPEHHVPLDFFLPQPAQFPSLLGVKLIGVP